uniref:PPM-type phosphatase domain-containing protein n=1 Tax=Anopheles funestus TaxID=62324 RepID=A0A182R5L7_ANOFN
MSIGVNLRVTGHTSIGGRKYQEDYFSVAYQQTENDQNLEYAYFGIYDGHGGAEASLYAKEHLMNTIVSQKLFWSENDDDVLKSIREGYIQTHYSMWREQDKWPKTSSGLPSTAGTTASIAFIRRGKIYIGHVGDSGIVLGYQNDKESAHDGRWVATPLTEDHKPESYAEKMRIMSCGGKVVTKSGVPRVVWNRPRIGHKGPVRRSTPIDEIPFLAVARSLGDLWSYNSAMDEFVVSPVPDVSVIEIDPKKYRCLIFGTDGLWNVMSPKNAVDIVRNAEMENIRIALEGGNEWKNPSKLLVNEALDRWSRSNMKADNTSVVIIMLDPPGPPKRDVLKSVKDTIQHVASDQLSAGQSAVGSNIIHLFDCITRGESLPAMSEMDSLRYNGTHHSLQLPHSYQHAHHSAEEEYCDTEGPEIDTRAVRQQQPEHQHHQMTHLQPVDQYSHALPSTSYQEPELSYTDSFAESYNTLLSRSFENTDHSYTSLFHPAADHGIEAEDVAESYRNKATMVEGVSHEEEDETMYDYSTISSDDETIGASQIQDSTYSLTNLQTKSERLRAEFIDSCSSPDAYYHQQRQPEESTAFSTGNLAIIEHFHNYHHPAPLGYDDHSRNITNTHDPSQETADIPARIESIGGAMRSVTHHNYRQYQIDLDEQYHHQQPQHTDSHYQDYQMERYDYRHHPVNNNGGTVVPCEATCSKYDSKSEQRNDVPIATETSCENEDEEEQEEMKEASSNTSGAAVHPHQQIISIHGHRIQINEISSSFVGKSTKVLLSHSDSESTSSTDGTGYSGDEENSASSTTCSSTGVKQMVVPVLVKQRSRKSGPPTRVITIFYETRSSRRQSRARNQPSSSNFTDFGRKRTELKPSPFGGIVKRRKTATVMRAAQDTIEHEKASVVVDRTDTFVRRALRSNGVVNAARSMLTCTGQQGNKLPSPAGTDRNPSMASCHQPRRSGLVANEFGVSTTTPSRCLALQTALKTSVAEKAERSRLSRSGCNTRRMRLDEQQQQQQHIQSGSSSISKKTITREALELLEGSKRAKQLRRAQ